eukprot:292594-Rhodomonas_salina.3
MAVWMMLASLTSTSEDPLQALRTLTEADCGDNIDILKPDLKNFRQALRHPFLSPLWMESATEEMTGLFKR